MFSSTPQEVIGLIVTGPNGLDPAAESLVELLGVPIERKRPGRAADPAMHPCAQPW